MGGVSSAEDVIEMMMAGATAVAIGSENLRNPTACRDIVLDLPDVMKRLGIAHLADIIGCAVP
jgi:dihydroorotate dehydrogenase (NAD+) catalytic subunit